MAVRMVPATKKGFHTYSVEGEGMCPKCSSSIPLGSKACPNCGTEWYRVEHDQDEGADFAVCDPICKASY